MAEVVEARRRGERGPARPKPPVERLGYRVPEVAEALGCSVTAVNTAIDRGQIEALTLADRTKVIPAWSLRRWLNLPDADAPNAAEELLVQALMHAAAAITSMDVTVHVRRHEGLRSLQGGKK
jgi:hypothetical protein